jgi:hypothetical protein
MLLRTDVSGLTVCAIFRVENFFSTLKMARTVGPETSIPNHIKTPGNYPKEEKLYTRNDMFT